MQQIEIVHPVLNRTLRLDNRSFNLWLGLVALSFVLGIGLSWSIFRRAVSGQADVDDVET
ncbi:hypothetical protein C1J04_07180 [Sulfitobacter sp. SK025]|nr:hypothetical protein C1J04_07180 [Sulfitobacter sp. SK025]